MGDMESYEFKTAITFACLNIFVGLVLILVCIPLYRGTVKMNRTYGFRCRGAFESEKNWYRINRFGAGASSSLSSGPFAYSSRRSLLLRLRRPVSYL